MMTFRCKYTDNMGNHKKDNGGIYVYVHTYLLALLCALSSNIRIPAKANTYIYTLNLRDRNLPSINFLSISLQGSIKFN